MKPSDRDDLSTMQHRALREFYRLRELFNGPLWQAVSSDISREQAEWRMSRAQRFLFNAEDYESAYRELGFLRDDVTIYLDRHRQALIVELEKLIEPEETPEPEEAEEPETGSSDDEKVS